MSSFTTNKPNRDGSSCSSGTLAHATILAHLTNSTIAANESANKRSPSESEGLDDNDNEPTNPPTQNQNHPQIPPSPSPSLTAHNPSITSESLAQITRNARLDAIQPTLTRFRALRTLHISQFESLQRRAAMVSSRIDKLNDDIENLRRQWSALEREKSDLLGSSQRYEVKLGELERVVRRDDGIARRVWEWLVLRREVLVLDSDDDEEEGEEGEFVRAQGGEEAGGGEVEVNLLG